MSPLIPANLSQTPNRKKKHEKDPTIYHGGYEEGLKKPHAVPITPVDPLELLEPDEPGAELAKEARFWKVYVKEADKWDTELIEGWNRSLDVILVFAALFSAVMTAFIIESSNMLEQDPNEISAAALVSISQVLLVMANGSSVNLPALTSLDSNETPGFVPPHHAIIVNTLWYLSLSLSIATSLLAMLAKDWCHSFAANRTGHPWDQALRRQRKWSMIEHWRMQELIAVLPFLIHVSLVLFAIGLCLYVWDKNTTAAIPVICVTGISFAFYAWSSIVASLVKLFPYTTIISRALQSDFMPHMYKRAGGLAYRASQSYPWKSLCYTFDQALFLVALVICSPLFVLYPLPIVILSTVITRPEGAGVLALEITDQVYRIIHRALSCGVYTLFRGIRITLAAGRWWIESADPYKGNQDTMTSLALQWLIQNCETPNSVAIALQAISGASSKIPQEPLESCQATLRILRRLASGSPEHGTESDTKLYTRALAVLGSRNGTQPSLESSGIEDVEVLLRELQSENERQVVDLINSTQFLPTEDNIQALIIGNTVTSVTLRLLQEGNQSAYSTFHTIINLLLGHIHSNNTKLYPASLQSLANAAVLLTSCSETTLLNSSLLKECMGYCIASLRTNAETPFSNNILPPETTLLLCMLLHGRRRAEADTTRTHTNLGAMVACASRVLMDKQLRRSCSHSAFYRVGLFEAVFNLGLYGIPSEGLDGLLLYRENLSITYFDSGLLLPQAAMTDHMRLNSYYLECLEFLTAIHRVHELVDVPSSRVTRVRTLPAPVYFTIIWIACLTEADELLTLCKQLLADSGFPKSNNSLASAIRPILPKLWDFYGVKAEVRPPVQSKWKAAAQWLLLEPKPAPSAVRNRSRHLAATQLWLLSHCNSTDIDPELGDPRLDLEKCIIEEYTAGNHLGVYSARVIDCILEIRGTQGYEGLSNRIEHDLRGISPLLRKLASFHGPGESSQTRYQVAPEGRVPSLSSSFDKALNTALPPSTPPSLLSVQTTTGVDLNGRRSVYKADDPVTDPLANSLQSNDV